MRITFLGSSHGVPEPNRKCSCSLLEVGDRKYFIDLGTNPVNELVNRGISLDRITACFVTHMHGDHLDGLVPYVDLMSWYYKTADPAIFLPKVGVIDTIKAYLTWTGAQLRESLRFCEISEGKFYEDDTISVTAVPTGHCDVSYSFIVEAEGKRILFSGDLHGGDGALTDYDRIIGEDHYDLAITECAHFDGNLYREPLFRNPPDRFILNHYSKKWLESCLQLKCQLSEKLNVEFATDGMVVEL